MTFRHGFLPLLVAALLIAQASGCAKENKGGAQIEAANVLFSAQEKATLERLGTKPIKELAKVEQKKAASIMVDHVLNIKPVALLRQACKLTGAAMILAGQNADICQKAIDQCEEQLKGKSDESMMAPVRARKAELNAAVEQKLATATINVQELIAMFDGVEHMFKDYATKLDCDSSKQDMEKLLTEIPSKYQGDFNQFKDMFGDVIKIEL